MKDVDRRRDGDDEQENGTNGEDRKGILIPRWMSQNISLTHSIL